jgi:DNA-binding PadR family transcriptional regulator
MHGYEIIGELSERTEGLWRPSPGSIYPTLQLLEDEGLVVVKADEAAGAQGAAKRRFALTPEGAAAAADLAKGPAPWEQMAAGAPLGARTLRHSVVRLIAVVHQVGLVGGPHELEETGKVLDEARRRLYVLLAEQGEAPGGRPGSAGSPGGAGGRDEATSTEGPSSAS